MKNTIYTLPQDHFVGGQTKVYRWNLLSKTGQPFDASRCSGEFALLDYSSKYDDNPIFTKKISFVSGDNGVINVATVTLDPADTLYLDGKYIYQLSITDVEGRTEIPNQGIFYISNNIHKSYFA